MEQDPYIEVDSTEYEVIDSDPDTDVESSGENVDDYESSEEDDKN